MEVIGKDKRLFRIPVYQRRYSWKDTDCKKLFKDLIATDETDTSHFTESLVYIEDNSRSSSQFSEDIVIDGQQRITTILLFLKAIEQIAIEHQNGQMAEYVQELLYNKPPKFDVIPDFDEKYKFKLRPVKIDQNDFDCVMCNNFKDVNQPSTIAVRYIKKLIEDY